MQGGCKVDLVLDWAGLLIIGAFYRLLLLLRAPSHGETVDALGFLFFATLGIVFTTWFFVSYVYSNSMIAYTFLVHFEHNMNIEVCHLPYIAYKIICGWF